MIYGDLGGSSLLLCCFTPIHGRLNGYLLIMDEQPIVNQAEGVLATLDGANLGPAGSATVTIPKFVYEIWGGLLLGLLFGLPSGNLT